MGGRITGELPLVGRRGHHCAERVEDDRTDRHIGQLTTGTGALGLLQGQSHGGVPPAGHLPVARSVAKRRLGDPAELWADVDLVGDLHQRLVRAEIEVLDDRPQVEVAESEVGEDAQITDRLGVIVGIG